MSGRTLMASPPTDTQIVAIPKEFEKGLRNAFVDAEERMGPIK